VGNLFRWRRSVPSTKRIISAGLGEFELKLVISFIALQFSGPPQRAGNFGLEWHGLFPSTGERLFGVTICHVIDGWKQCPAEERLGPLRLGGMGTSLRLDGDQRVIDMDAGIDIATFQVTESEVKTIDKVILTGAENLAPWGTSG
jgi:hypothetical protein